MPNRFILTSALAAIPLALATPSSHAFETQDLDSIRSAAERTVRESAAAGSGGNAAQGASAVTVQVAPLDPRLRVAACDRALTGFITNNGQVRAQTSIGVRCEGSVRWTVYVSVAVESQTDVLVARHTMPRDTELTAADFTVENRRVPGLASGYVGGSGALAGQRLGRAIDAGAPLTLEVLAPANLIHRGQQVVLLAHAGGFEVRMGGVALADGRALQRIKVQNSSSQRVVEGVVLSSSEIEIPL
ncbi:MAG TPA: flagellar basal body P-ring formation chaperone FlgA [Steroidobacteraceae bacterium]|jgi:flagella basal body P-ring formation protein FlgA|nr:flagellar basal body P-ring formation chaperone FlgA [Steroidobacteraceae bacterium]